MKYLLFLFFSVSLFANNFSETMDEPILEEQEKEDSFQLPSKEDDQSDVFDESDHVSSPLKWRMGLEYYAYRYEEPSVMKDEGNFYGLAIGLSHNASILLDGEIRYSQGEVDYESNGTGSYSGAAYHTLELRGLVGKTLLISPRFSLTPFGGWLIGD